MKWFHCPDCGHEEAECRFLAPLEDDLEGVIEAATGFNAGAPFDDPEEVRAYFTVESMREMFGRDWGQVDLDCGHSVEGDVDQAQLDRWANAVIENCWHCDWNKIILCYNDEFISQMFAEPDGPVMADSSLLYEAATAFHDHITEALTDAGVDWEWAKGQCRGYHGWRGSHHPAQGIWDVWKSWTHVSDDVKTLVNGAAIKAQEAGQVRLNEDYRREYLEGEGER